MKIASITCYNDKDKIGGGYIPAVAFKKWCDILGVDCDLLSYYPGIDLSCYDSVFLATSDIPFNHNRIPKYVVMIHAEFDIFNRSLMDYAKAVVVIDKDMSYWDFHNQIFWYPCTLPEFLLTGGESFENDRKGTLYAARLSTWKNADVLLAYSNLETFQKDYGPITVYGNANKEYFDTHIRTCTSNANLNIGVYNIADMPDICKQHKYFWDVSGNNKYKLQIKRLNLSAFEAMKYGCIPIVNREAVPDEINEFSVDFRNLHKASELNLHKMLKAAKHSYFGYNAVKNQVERIIEELI